MRGSRLSVLLLKEGRTIAADPIDLSVTGILIEFTKVSDPNLSRGAHIELELQLGVQVVRVKAEVRHHEGQRYGLLFYEIASRQGLNPSKPLQSIVTEVERLWLEERR